MSNIRDFVLSGNLPKRLFYPSALFLLSWLFFRSPFPVSAQTYDVTSLIDPDPLCDAYKVNSFTSPHTGTFTVQANSECLDNLSNLAVTRTFSGIDSHTYTIPTDVVYGTLNAQVSIYAPTATTITGSSTTDVNHSYGCFSLGDPGSVTMNAPNGRPILYIGPPYDDWHEAYNGNIPNLFSFTIPQIQCAMNCAGACVESTTYSQIMNYQSFSINSFKIYGNENNNCDGRWCTEVLDMDFQFMPNDSGAFINVSIPFVARKVQGSNDPLTFQFQSEISALGILNWSENWSISGLYAGVRLEELSQMQMQTIIDHLSQLRPGSSLDTLYTEIRDNHDEMMDFLHEDDTTGASSSFSNYFLSHQNQDFGLSSVITAPLSSIQAILTSQCAPLVLPLPYLNENITLPCLTPIYQQFFGPFLTLYQTVILGITTYWVSVNLFKWVKDFQDPEKDNIEVTDL